MVSELVGAGLAVLFGCFAILILPVLCEVAREGPQGVRRARLERKAERERQEWIRNNRQRPA